MAERNGNQWRMAAAQKAKGRAQGKLAANGRSAISKWPSAREIGGEWPQRNRQMAEREGNRRRMAAAPPGLLASARWQRENPMIKLAGLGAMAARESNNKICWPRRDGSARIQQYYLLVSARWQRENPMIKLAGLGAMAARESNKLPSAATRVRKDEHGAPLKRGASGRIMT